MAEADYCRSKAWSCSLWLSSSTANDHIPTSLPRTSRIISWSRKKKSSWTNRMSHQVRNIQKLQVVSDISTFQWRLILLLLLDGHGNSFPETCQNKYWQCLWEKRGWCAQRLTDICNWKKKKPSCGRTSVKMDQRDLHVIEMEPKRKLAFSENPELNLKTITQMAVHRFRTRVHSEQNKGILEGYYALETSTHGGHTNRKRKRRRSSCMSEIEMWQNFRLLLLLESTLLRVSEASECFATSVR